MMPDLSQSSLLSQPLADDYPAPTAWDTPAALGRVWSAGATTTATAPYSADVPAGTFGIIIGMGQGGSTLAGQADSKGNVFTGAFRFTNPDSPGFNWTVYIGKFATAVSAGVDTMSTASSIATGNPRCAAMYAFTGVDGSYSNPLPLNLGAQGQDLTDVVTAGGLEPGGIAFAAWISTPSDPFTLNNPDGAQTDHYQYSNRVVDALWLPTPQYNPYDFSALVPDPSRIGAIAMNLRAAAIA